MNIKLALRMAEPIILVALFLTITNTTFAQLNEWSTQPSIEMSYSTLKTDRYNFPTVFNPDEVYFENTINLSLSAPITQRLRTGLRYTSIANKVIREPIDRAYAIGVFGQFNVVARKKLSVYIEGGYTMSNLCNCGEAEIYATDTLIDFVHFGIGVNYKLNSRFHLTAGFTNYSPIFNADAYNWTQPVFGLKYHFYKKYNTPFKSRFREQKNKTSRAGFGRFWIDENVRTWNIGFQVTGPALAQNTAWRDVNVSPLRYIEFSMTPRIHYWINQAIMVGVQGSYYYYDNEYNSIQQQSGLGFGAQARFYPLSFKNTAEHRTYRITRNGDLNIAPMFGAEIHIANYSWLAPENAGEQWQYFDFQPIGGFVLAYKNWLNLVWSIGPTIGRDFEIVTPTNGNRMIGLEYNFSR